MNYNPVQASNASTLDRLVSFLTAKRTLWITFAITLALTLAFAVVMAVGGFVLIDEMWIAGDIQDHIAAMTPKQRELHAWTTGTLDVAYPLAYGAFFVGVALRFFKRFRYWLALPSLLVIPIDLTEGYAQIMLLMGDGGFMDLKVLATQAKLALFVAGLCITALGLAIGLKKRLGSR